MLSAYDMEEGTSTASEDFKINRMNGKRYVDKTKLLIPLLRGDHETTFFLRPRRFGKTLTLSMLHYFMEDTRDEKLNEENRSLFQGLEIMEAGERYTSQMTSSPVIHLTMQTVGGPDYKTAQDALLNVIQKLYQEKSWLLESEILDTLDRRFFDRILLGEDETGCKQDLADVTVALKNLSEYLRRVSGKRTVILIDEYDVPLEKAYRNGYYRQMIHVIGPLMQNALKTNSVNLRFAVVTGCLRIAKEGIYTGLNNPDINTVLSFRNSDAFGFTEQEVSRLLAESGVPERREEVRDWYDGYRFGNTVIYNPWSVIKYIEDVKVNPEAPPASYWANTSENAIIRELAERADDETREKAESLLSGEEISFALREDLVYDNLFRDPDHVFNVMLATGYLTAMENDGSVIHARIPNREIKQIYTRKFEEWFKASVNTFPVRELYDAMEHSLPERVQSILNDRFLSTMSYFDTLEAFYHGVLLTLMQLNEGYLCRSNRESGNGRFDVMCKQKREWKLAFVLECKVSDDPREMREDARRAADQISEKGYVADLLAEGYETILTYGFAFCEKRCRVVQGKTYLLEEA